MKNKSSNKENSSSPTTKRNTLIAGNANQSKDKLKHIVSIATPKSVINIHSESSSSNHGATYTKPAYISKYATSTSSSQNYLPLTQNTNQTGTGNQYKYTSSRETKPNHVYDYKNSSSYRRPYTTQTYGPLNSSIENDISEESNAVRSTKTYQTVNYSNTYKYKPLATNQYTKVENT